MQRPGCVCQSVYIPSGRQIFHFNCRSNAFLSQRVPGERYRSSKSPTNRSRPALPLTAGYLGMHSCFLRNAAGGSLWKLVDAFEKELKLDDSYVRPYVVPAGQRSAVCICRSRFANARHHDLHRVMWGRALPVRGSAAHGHVYAVENQGRKMAA